jgi:hypothetical protein
MGEHRFRQIHTNIGDSLPLSLVYCHGKTESDRELLPLELEREPIVIRWA